MKKVVIVGVILLFLGSSIPALASPGNHQRQIQAPDAKESRGYSISLRGTEGKNGWYVSNVAVEIRGLQGNESVFYSLDYGYWQSYTKPITVTTDGNYFFIAVIIDQHGNVTLLNPVVIKIDKTTPCFIYNKNILLFRIKFTALAKDNTSGLDRIEFWIGPYLQYTHKFNQPFGEQTVTWVYHTLFHHTNYSYDVRVFDLAGNYQLQGPDNIQVQSQNQSNHDSSTIPVLPGNNLPCQCQELNTQGYNITLQGGRGNNGWFVGNVNVTITGSQDNTSVFYNLDFGQWQPYQSPITIRSDGNHTFIAIVKNQDGNVTLLDPVLIKIDQTQPYLVWYYDILLFKIKYTAITQDNISGMDRVEFWIGPFLQYTYRFNNPSGVQVAYWILHPVPHISVTVTVIAYDLAGNEVYYRRDSASLSKIGVKSV